MSRVNKIMVIQCKKRETVKFKLIKFSFSFSLIKEKTRPLAETFQDQTSVAVKKRPQGHLGVA